MGDPVDKQNKREEFNFNVTAGGLNPALEVDSKIIPT